MSQLQMLASFEFDNDNGHGCSYAQSTSTLSACSCGLARLLLQPASRKVKCGQGPVFGPGDLAEIGVHLDQQDWKWTALFVILFG